MACCEKQKEKRHWDPKTKVRTPLSLINQWFRNAERAGEGSVSPVGSAGGKRPESVGAKQVQAPLQGACTQIERTGESHPAPLGLEKHLRSAGA